MLKHHGQGQRVSCDRCVYLLMYNNIMKYIFLFLFYVALAAAEATYRDKSQQGVPQVKVLTQLGWKVEELQRLLKENQQITVNVNSLVCQLEGAATDIHVSDATHKLTNIKKQMTSFVRSISRYKRTPASHIFVLMISCERRQVKPYALPIQLLPYDSINVSTMRRIICNVLKVMKSRGMSVVGKYNMLVQVPTTCYIHVYIAIDACVHTCSLNSRIIIIQLNKG